MVMNTSDDPPITRAYDSARLLHFEERVHGLDGGSKNHDYSRLDNRHADPVLQHSLTKIHSLNERSARDAGRTARDLNLGII